MMLKKMLIVIPLVLCALVGRNDSITIGDFTYWYSLSTKEGSVTKYNGSSESVEIPSTFHAPETYKDKDGETHTQYHAITVTDIGNSAFRDNTSMKTVSFHNKLKSIGSCAFYGCTALASVATSTSLTSLGSYAFAYCSGLEEAEIDGSDLNLDTSYGLFAECPNLKRVVLGDGVKSLPTAITSLYSSRSGLFSSCPKLQSVTVGSGVTIIPSYLFYDCGNPDDKLSVSFVARVTSVGSRAFSNGNITDVNIDFSRTTTIDGYAFDGCVGIRGELNLPAVRSIGGSAFYDCIGIASVNSGNNLESIGLSAFYNCTNASSFSFAGTPPSVGSYAFRNVKSGAVGTYTAEHVAEWEAVIDSKGYWNGLKMKPSYYTVIYNANNGTGETFSQTVEWGEAQQAADGTFTWEGHYFMGWAFAPDGEVAYAVGDAVAEPTDDRVVRVYAKWSKLTLTAESADWSLGSITLRCEDSDTSGTEHTYSLMYYEDVEAEKRWYGIDGAQLVKATAEVDAEGNDVLVARLIDARFAKRMDGIHTVKYRVMDENGRVAECVTRNRHGLFVAVDEYENGWLEAHANHAHQVSVFRGAYLKYGDADGYMPRVLNGSNASRDAILIQLKYIAENVALPGDIVVFYYVGHGTDGLLSCYNRNATISAAELYESFTKFPNGTGVVALIDSCHSATMINRGDMDGNGMGNIAWIVAAQANETTYCGAFKALVCDRGWFNGEADVYGGNVFADNNGYVTFGELAAWGQQVMGDRNNYTSGNAYPFRPEDYGHMTSHYNSLVLENIVAGRVPPQTKTSRIWTWLTSFPTLFATSGGDETAVVNTTAANGCRTVGECYELGIDPEDPNDDLKIAEFKMKDGKPEITLNHTKDGSGNSFEDRIKILGKAELTDAEWQEVPPEGNPAHRFFKVGVEMP